MLKFRCQRAVRLRKSKTMLPLSKKVLTSVSKDLWSEWYGVIFDPTRTKFQILLFFVSVTEISIQLIDIELKRQNNATILLREKRVDLF